MSIRVVVALCVLLTLVGPAFGRMTLTGILLPGEEDDPVLLEDDSIHSETLRGSRPGDIWRPSTPGYNILHCGQFGNTNYLGSPRVEIEPGQSFKINGAIHEMVGKGAITVELKYATPVNPANDDYADPNFLRSPGILLLAEPYYIEPKTEAQLEPPGFRWQLEVPGGILEPGYDGWATIQVAFQHSNTTFFQCIDVVVLGEQRSSPDWSIYGWPENEFIPAPGPVIQALNSGSSSDDAFLTDFQWIVIAVIFAALCAFTCLFWKCRASEEDELDGQGEFASQKVDEVKSLPKVVPDEPPLPKPLVPLVPTPPQPEPESPVLTDGEDEIPQPVDPGSKGRHFHFRYVEENED